MNVKQSEQRCNEKAMVTILLDEYFELRSKAETNLYLMTELARVDNKFSDVWRRIAELEEKIDKRELR